MRGAAILTMFLASVSTAGAQAVFPYRCGDGTTLTASFAHAPERIILNLGNKILTLPQERAASGARYRLGPNMFWIKGRDADFERGGKSTQCHTDR